ncbi:MAG: methyltransferase domain-containing protein [Burkholderiaceae bacterium]
MPAELPPSIDPRAAERWALHPQSVSPWLHEEIGRRMQERLQWIRLQPGAWTDWEPVRGGLQAHAAVVQRYPQARSWIVEPTAQRQRAAQAALQSPWWRPARWLAPTAQAGDPPDGASDLVWANMALHMAADPGALLGRWLRMLAVDGFLMFSCLGPDTLLQLRGVYAEMGWPEPAHNFTDMHDWGDMMLTAGYAEPVMDMERITLTYTSAERLLSELRGLGRNLQPQRFAGMRGRGWKDRLLQAVSGLGDGASGDGSIALTFEVIYGHALKPQPRVLVQSETQLSLDDMRRILKQGKRDPAQTR